MSVREVIEDLVRNSGENCLSKIDGSRIFEKPIVGFADGDNRLFVEYKKTIGDFHFTPREILRQHFPSWNDRDDHCSVICWVLPIAEKTKISNTAQTEYPSERWAHTKLYGERFNNHLRQTVVGHLMKRDKLAVAPVLSPHFTTRYTLDIASSWSERHALYAAGLGTFSLSDGFITPKGMAMRCGSVVTNLKLEPTVRKYENHMENCLFFSSGECGICIERCPVGAIDESGHDKVKCRKFCNGAAADYALRYYKIRTNCCGLCQTGVPCESEIPK